MKYCPMRFDTLDWINIYRMHGHLFSSDDDKQLHLDLNGNSQSTLFKNYTAMQVFNLYCCKRVFAPRTLQFPLFYFTMTVLKLRSWRTKHVELSKYSWSWLQCVMVKNVCFFAWYSNKWGPSTHHSWCAYCWEWKWSWARSWLHTAPAHFYNHRNGLELLDWLPWMIQRTYLGSCILYIRITQNGWKIH